MAEETSLRDDIEQAIQETEEAAQAALDAAPTPEPEPEPQEAAPEPQEASEPEPAAEPEPEQETRSERRRDAKGRFLADEHHPGDEEKYPTLTDTRVDAAPEGWRPTARAAWENLPPEVRREIHRRELDIATGLQGAASARTTAEQFEKVVAPYQPIIDAHGAPDALTAVGGLLKTAATLHQGNAAQKAQQIATLIESYGVDVNVLADVIEKGEQQTPPNPLEERLNKLEQYTQQQNQRISQQHLDEADRALAEFAQDRPYYKDVRTRMADLMETASARNERMTLEEAYDIACYASPEVRALKEREQALATKEAEVEAARKAKLAETSLNGSPGGAGANGIADPSRDLRGDIMAAMARLEDR